MMNPKHDRIALMTILVMLCQVSPAFAGRGGGRGGGGRGGCRVGGFEGYRGGGMQSLNRAPSAAAYRAPGGYGSPREMGGMSPYGTGLRGNAFEGRSNIADGTRGAAALPRAGFS